VCIVLVKPFVCFHEVGNPLLEVVKRSDVHSIDDGWPREVAHNRLGNVAKFIESSGTMKCGEFGIGSPDVGIGCVQYRL